MDTTNKTDIDKVFKQALSGGLTITGDLVAYYHEGQKKGIGVMDYLVLKAVAGGNWRDLKETFTPVALRDLDLAKPCQENLNLQWSSGYQNIMDQAGISYKDVREAAKAFSFEQKGKNALVTIKVVIREDHPSLEDLHLEKVVEILPGGLKVLEQYTYEFPVIQPKTPLYIPRYRTIQPDKAMFDRFAKLVKQAPPELFHEFEHMYNSLVEYSYSYVLCSGDYVSQIGRIKKGFKVYTETLSLSKGFKKNGLAEALSYTSEIPVNFESNQRLREPQINFEAYSMLMKKRAPFRKRENFLILNLVDILALSYITRLNCREGFNLWTINKDASAGGWLGDAKKEDTLYTDIHMATWLLNQLQLCLDKDKLDEQKYSKFLKDYESLFIPQTKNKMEIGQRDKIKKDRVWRNYFVFNNFVQLPGQILMEHIYAKDPTDTRILYKNQKNPEIWSLLGWSAYHFGLYDLLKTMAIEAYDKGYSIAVYSDNLYVLQYIENDYWWYSLDGSSMETSIDYHDASYFMRHVLQDFWDSKVTAAWDLYARRFYADININGTALLGNMQWRNVGQFSGQGGTAYLNNAKMITCAAVLDHKLRNWKTCLLNDKQILPVQESTQVYGERVLVPELDECFFLRGVLLKVELVTRSSLFNCIRIGGRPQSKANQRLRLDLLGFDALFTPSYCPEGGPVYPFPVLNQDKLLASFVYNKQKEKETHAVSRVLGISRLKAFYLLGCWAHIPLAALIRDRIASLECNDFNISVLDEAGKEKLITEVISVVAGELELPDSEALATALQSFRIPTFYDVFSVYANVDFAESFILSIIVSSGPRSAVLYATPTKVLEVTFNWLEHCKEQGKKSIEPELGQKVYEFIQVTCSSENGIRLLENIRQAHPDLIQELMFLGNQLNQRTGVRIVNTAKEVEVIKPVKRRTYEVEWPEAFTKLNLKDSSRPLPLPFSFKKDIPLKPLTYESQGLLSRVVDYLRDSDIKIGELYDYGRWFRDAGLTKEDQDGIKHRKETAQFLTHLDVKVGKMIRDRLASMDFATTPNKFQEEVVLKRLNRKVEKKIKKFDKQQEVEIERIKVVEEKERLRKQQKKKRKALEEQERRERSENTKNKFSLPLSKLIKTALSSEKTATSDQLTPFLNRIKVSSATPRTLQELELGDQSQNLKDPEQVQEFMHLVVILAKNYHVGCKGPIQDLGIAKAAALKIRMMVKVQDCLDLIEIVL